MIDKEIVKIVSDTADKLKVDPLTKSVAVMSAVLGSSDSAVNILMAGSNKIETEKAEKEYPEPSKPLDYSPIEREIADMLQTSTGTDMLDSGGLYGRNWQKNRLVVDFRKLKLLSVDVSNYNGKLEVSFSLNIFHYLTSFLDLDANTEKWNKDFKEFCDREDNQDSSYPALCEEFVSRLYQLGEIDNDVSSSFNSYNREDMLSQVIQGEYFDGEYPEYVLLQIHQGCDVRGGYTAPRVLRIKDFEYFAMAANNLTASCKCKIKGDNLYLNSDDIGYHWYVFGSTGDLSRTWNNSLPDFWIEKRKRVYCKKCKHYVTFSPDLSF